jgi:hypothetical protein
MRNLIFLCLAVLLLDTSCTNKTSPGQDTDGTIINDTIQYHPVRLDADGNILPWFSSDAGASYDTALLLVWNFWKNMETDSNGLKYYMNHQVWKPEHDPRGLGGDQINMALSAWALLYRYTGDQSVIGDMKYMADEYLARSLSGPSSAWPNLPYPYNTDIHSGIYDGDMRNGKDILQPDKAGNFGYELVTLYKITGEQKYLDAAVKIAAVLAENTRPGNNDESPLPFRVNAKTGQTGQFYDNMGSGKVMSKALYTSNWTCTMMLFQELLKLDTPHAESWQKAFDTMLAWMKEYPLKTNKWGPFFEDVPGWSDTQTNAISFAMFIMNNRDLFPEWMKDVQSIFGWTYQELGNHEYDKYGVTVMNEQTVYRVPGNSHSSRQASMELLYTSLSGDSTYRTNAIRTLHWATYTVDHDGKNRYIRDDIWLTDGYGDYVRHYLRAMAACPELAPAHKNKLLDATSVITHVEYSPAKISWTTYDPSATELLRLTSRPVKVLADDVELAENEQPGKAGWTWEPLKQGGILRISHSDARNVSVVFQ